MDLFGEILVYLLTFGGVLIALGATRTNLLAK
jgi:hypothetical protein